MANSTPSPKFSAFTITDAIYKRINGTPIPASILVPKGLKPGKHPLTVRWHGGFLVTGQRLYADWYPHFMLDFALKHQAIIVTPDYRLMPEANGLDILNDVKCFFAWLLEPGNLASHLPAGVEVDLDNILITGESAGGWLAWQSAVLYPKRAAAVIAHYPMLDLRAPHYTQAYEKQLFTPPAPQLPRHILDDFLRGLQGNEVVSSAIPPERVPLVLSIMQQGRIAEFLGKERVLYPLEVLGELVTLPPMWILHGEGDSGVPVEGTHRYVEKLRERMPDAKLHLSVEQGEHGFDNHMPDTGEPASLAKTEWVKEGVKFVEQYWPVKS